MAIRNIRKVGDEILSKPCREVEVIDQRVIELLDDMAETMHHADGVGLAAPQVGVLKRVVVIDVGDGVLELINPVIVGVDGTQREVEGCLSVPGKYGEVIRPAKIVVNALDRHGNGFEVMGQDLLARALAHEIDHLDGHLFVEKVLKYVEVD